MPLTCAYAFRDTVRAACAVPKSARRRDLGFYARCS
jgi:hypothetical protein